MAWRSRVVLWITLVAAIAAASALVFAWPLWPSNDVPISGFATTSLAAQHNIEQRIARFPSVRRLEADHRFLTAEPHIAGSPRDRGLAEWTRDQWRAAGLDSVDIVEHDVLLSYPGETVVEMLAPQQWRATLHENDPNGGGTAPAYHAYAASGDVTAPIVYAGGGTDADFDWLADHGVDVRGKIVLLRYAVPYSYRGYKVFTAQQRGAAAVLMFSDPDDDGNVRGRVYPSGPWGPDDRVQRGAVSFDFLAPGDPLTPGWASTIGARRLRRDDAVTLPAIMSVPISARDAHTLLGRLDGPAPPRSWRGGLDGGYRVGPGALVHIRVKNDEAVRPIWTVIGRISGSTYPDEWVIAGNHRDAWVYGGVDPSSGSAVLMEMARTLGSLARAGLRPKRTIVMASWDAEEFSLTSSTEWGEQHAAELRDKAVAYLNVDAAVSGSTFSARAVPSLADLVTSIPGVADPKIDTRVGGGSDYTVFLNFLGVPIVDMRFEGPYGVYHSAYDNHDWVARFADPGFLRHAALTRIWSMLATRIANADLLPLDELRYAERIGDFLDEARQRLKGTIGADGTPELLVATAALKRFEMSAQRARDEGVKALELRNRRSLDLLNRRLMNVEPALLDDGGLRGRPWYRHQVFAPSFSYEPEVLPGLSEAIAARDPAAVAEQERRLAAAFDRAAKALNP